MSSLSAAFVPVSLSSTLALAIPVASPARPARIEESFISFLAKPNIAVEPTDQPPIATVVTKFRRVATLLTFMKEPAEWSEKLQRETEIEIKVAKEEVAAVSSETLRQQSRCAHIERLKQRRLKRIEPSKTAGNNLCSVGCYEGLLNFMTQAFRGPAGTDELAQTEAIKYIATHAAAGKLTQLAEKMIGLIANESNTRRFNDGWTIIQKYYRSFNLFRIDPDNVVCLLNGERTSLRRPDFFAAINKVMRAHLSKLDLFQDFETTEIVSRRPFDIQFENGELTIITAGKLVGSGGYGDVYKALNLTTGECTAQKVAKTNSDGNIDSDTFHCFLQEFNNAQWLPKREGIICASKMLKSVTKTGSKIQRLSLLSPFCSKGDLFSLLENPLLTALARIQLIKSIWQLSSELLFIDQTWHSDIKLENYMLLEFPKLGLIDWDSAKRRRGFCDFVAHGGTPQYYCAELAIKLQKAIEEKNAISFAAIMDQRMLYMTATTMYTVLCGHEPRPYDKMRFQDMSFQVQTKTLQQYPKDLQNFVCDLLQSNPEARLTSWETADKRFKELVYK